MGLFTRRSRDRYHNLDDPAETWELERPGGRSQSSGKSGGSSKSRSGTGPSGGGAGGGDQSRSNLYLTGDQDGLAPLAHTAAEERMGRVQRLLEGFGLSAYAAAFESEGYDDLSFLLGMSGDERIGVAWAVGMSEEHAQVFVREMGSLSEHE